MNVNVSRHVVLVRWESRVAMRPGVASELRVVNTIWRAACSYAVIKTDR
jgi:hypothetical protein